MSQLIQSLEGCKVEPIAPNVLSKSSNYARNDYGTLGNFAWVGACILSFIILANIDEKLPGWIWFAPFIVPFFVRSWLIETLREKESEKNRDTINAKNYQDSLTEAENTTRNVRGYVSSALKQIESLRTNMHVASQLIEQADYEFRQNAYSPFWDKVHLSIEQLAKCQQNIHSLECYARWYSDELAGRQHNFPAYPVTANLVPDVTKVSRNLQRVIRQGQTNFEFSSIYEQRRTREVMIAGFKSLGEAVDKFGSTIEQSFSSFLSQLETVVHQTSRR